jgi:GNAT superfamily N-acetyltransferase
MHRIRPARPAETEPISALAFRSKAHWGYTPEQLAIFRDELTIAPDELEPTRAHVLEWECEVVGFYTLAPFDAPNAIELGHLFVDPDCLRRGFGRKLFQHAREVARAEGFGRLFIQSDPNAAGFYRALGASFERDTPTSIPGRTLPLFSLALQAPQ